jgi:hypothetical protein
MRLRPPGPERSRLQQPHVLVETHRARGEVEFAREVADGVGGGHGDEVRWVHGTGDSAERAPPYNRAITSDVYVNVKIPRMPAMNLLEAQLTTPGRHPARPAPRSDVAPGVRWIRMALPFALDHINLWLLRDDGWTAAQGWTVVDCCISATRPRRSGSRCSRPQLEGLPVLRVIVTHMHPDHIGLAHWLCERWSTPDARVPLWISATDYNAARIASQSTTASAAKARRAFFGSHGLNDPEALEKIRGRASYYPGMVPAVPASFRAPGRRRAHRRPRLALHQRLRPRAGAHRAALRGTCRC